jgi:hypothetical protein
MAQSHYVLFTILALAIVCLVVASRFRKTLASNTKVAEAYRAFLARWTKWKGSVIPVAKQLFGFFQVVVLLRSVYRIPFPTLYIDVLNNWFAFANLDLVFIFNLECAMKTNWHARVYMMGFLCFCCLIGTALNFECFRHNNRPGLVIQWLQAIGNMLLVLGYFIYASANTIFFQTFNCQQIDSASYLRNDLSIDCSDPAHKSCTAFATIMVFFFSVGLPAMYLLLLLPHRKGFLGQSGRSQAALSDVKILHFFYADYKGEFYYWEILECLRKLLITGVAVAIVPGSLIQLVVSLAVIAVYAVAVALFRPYRTARDNTLALVLYAMLSITLLIGLLLKVSRAQVH